MYIYNVTINIEESIHQQWLEWVKSHISKILETGCFTGAKMTRVLVEEEMGGLTYSIQFRAPSRESLNLYYKEHSQKLRSEATKKFGSNMLIFRTELKVIEEFFSTVTAN